jgi:hypothetical protein
MPIKVLGESVGTVCEVDANTLAGRMVEKPPIGASLGSYCNTLTSGTMAANLAVNSNVYHFRNTSDQILCKINKVRISLQGPVSLSFTPGSFIVELHAVRNMIAVPSVGTLAQLASNGQKLRTRMPSTKLNNVQTLNGVTVASGLITISTTGALTTVGGTLDVDPHAAIATCVEVTGTRYSLIVEENLFEYSYYPLILSEWEGFTIQMSPPTLGDFNFKVTTQWDEVLAYN